MKNDVSLNSFAAIRLYGTSLPHKSLFLSFFRRSETVLRSFRLKKINFESLAPLRGRTSHNETMKTLNANWFQFFHLCCKRAVNCCKIKYKLQKVLYKMYLIGRVSIENAAKYGSYAQEKWFFALFEKLKAENSITFATETLFQSTSPSLWAVRCLQRWN